MSTDWAFNSQCLNDSGCALHSRLAYDLNTTARTTTEPWESLALERETSRSRASTPWERRARDHRLCLLRPNTVSPLNPLHADQPPFTPPVSASAQVTAATRANAVAFESFVFKCMIFIFYHIENLRICVDVYNTWRKTPLAVADDDLG